MNREEQTEAAKNKSDLSSTPGQPYPWSCKRRRRSESGSGRRRKKNLIRLSAFPLVVPVVIAIMTIIRALHMAHSSCVAWPLLLLVVIVMSGKCPIREWLGEVLSPPLPPKHSFYTHSNLLIFMTSSVHRLKLSFVFIVATVYCQLPFTYEVRFCFN